MPRITEPTLRSLLTSQRLSSLHLHSVAAFTDQLVFALLQEGRLAFLEALVVQHCSGITAVAISLLLATSSPLTTLACWGCSLTEEEKEAVTKASTEANLNLTIDWKGRDTVEEVMDDLPDLEDMEEILAQLLH